MICENKFSDIKDKSFSRGEQVLLAQLRCGECYQARKFRKRSGIDTGCCRWCKTEEEIIYHLYEECNNNEIVNLRSDAGIKGSKALRKDGTKALEFFKKAVALLMII